MRHPSFALKIVIIGWITVLAGIAFCCWLAAFIIHVLVVNMTGIR